MPEKSDSLPLVLAKNPTDLFGFRLKSDAANLLINYLSDQSFNAGITVLTKNLKINSEYDLILPVCDFYTSDDGKTLNKAGIEPNILKSGEDVMKYVLSII